MREINFRGKCVENDEYVYGYLIKAIDNKFKILVSEGFFLEVYEDSIGEYSGFKDKNKIKIYENDKVRFKYSPEDVFIVKYSLGKFFLDSGSVKLYNEIYFYECEVIL